MTAMKNYNRCAILTMTLPSSVYDDCHPRRISRQGTKHAVRYVQIKSRKPPGERHSILCVRIHTRRNSLNPRTDCSSCNFTVSSNSFRCSSYTTCACDTKRLPPNHGFVPSVRRSSERFSSKKRLDSGGCVPGVFLYAHGERPSA